MTDAVLKAVEAATGTDLGAIQFLQGGLTVKAAKSVIVDIAGNPFDLASLAVVGAGSGAAAQRVQLSDETLQAMRSAVTQGATAAGGDGAALTLTLPAAGAGLYHYLDGIEIVLYNTAARTGAATPVSVTSTNLPGGLAWIFPTAGVVGTQERQLRAGARLLRSLAANTASTIVCPATTGARWAINVTYLIAP